VVPVCARQRAETVRRGTVVFVVGLAGSGKSHYIERLRPDWACDEGFMAAGLHEANHRKLVRMLRMGKLCAVAELQLLNRYVRPGYAQRLKRNVPSARVRWVFFENNLSAANRNCRLRKNKPMDRGGKAHIRLNEARSPYYYVPPGAKTIRIHRLGAP
jgi:hypothetical protein